MRKVLASLSPFLVSLFLRVSAVWDGVMWDVLEGSTTYPLVCGELRHTAVFTGALSQYTFTASIRVPPVYYTGRIYCAALIMTRAKRAALSLFFLAFQGKKASSFRIEYEGWVPRTLYVCMLVCLYRVLRPRLSTALSVHGTTASSDGSCARTNDTHLF